MLIINFRYNQQPYWNLAKTCFISGIFEINNYSPRMHFVLNLDVISQKEFYLSTNKTYKSARARI